MKENVKFDYRWLAGPEPLAQVALPEPDNALVEGKMVLLKEARQKIARKIVGAKKPVVFAPAPTILWAFDESAAEKAKVLRELADAMKAEIRPVFDVRPPYPIARTAVEINPYHGDLVIAHEKYDVAVFYGINCPYADVALKIISVGTDCYTIALCGKLGHVDASITLRDTGVAGLKKIKEAIQMERNLAY